MKCEYQFDGDKIEEGQLKHVDTKSKASLWLETIQEGLDKVNAMFDLELSVKFRFDQEVDDNAAVDNGLV